MRIIIVEHNNNCVSQKVEKIGSSINRIKPLIKQEVKIFFSKNDLDSKKIAQKITSLIKIKEIKPVTISLSNSNLIETIRAETDTIIIITRDYKISHFLRQNGSLLSEYVIGGLGSIIIIDF
ncbi:MAG: hypothetical protein PHP97_02140 [Candidatus Shapirobacteria bacterium]|nr:hypothetical protein [Candidatus Shapirobacteria bacterium]MDD3002598.1 hypothetical protein [Candidatus Shapirobacteria bacterium]MDD4382795.1 hypothetical protein [Candidatus Shapirobacteria bacterium]